MSEQVENTDWECPDCDRSTDTEFGMSNHIFTRHSPDDGTELYELACELRRGEHSPNKGQSWEHDEETRENYEGPKSEEHRKKIIEANKRRWEDPEWKEMMIEKLREGRGEYPTGEDHPNYGKRWSWSEEAKERNNPEQYLPDKPDNQVGSVYVEKTDREVYGNWEARVDRILHDIRIEYGYETESFELGSQTYIPDFIVEDDIIFEVKGKIWDKPDVRSQEFMQDYPEYTYVVIGGTEIREDISFDFFIDIRQDNEEIETDIMGIVNDD